MELVSGRYLLETMGPETTPQLRRTSILRLAKLMLHPDSRVYAVSQGLIGKLLRLLEGVVDEPTLGEPTAALLLVLYHDPQHFV